MISHNPANFVLVPVEVSVLQAMYAIYLHLTQKCLDVFPYIWWIKELEQATVKSIRQQKKRKINNKFQGQEFKPHAQVES